jgi:primosomal protein N' (replication factor Y)
VGRSVVKGLVKLGVVAEEDAPRDTPYPRLEAGKGVRLEGDQVAAGDALVGRWRWGGIRRRC